MVAPPARRRRGASGRQLRVIERAVGRDVGDRTALDGHAQAFAGFDATQNRGRVVTQFAN
jgi:hypothetical protein